MTHIIYGLIILALLWGLAVVGRALKQAAQRTADAEHACTAWENEVITQKATAHNFVNAARIIAIHKSGRLLCITVARGDKTMIIEAFSTMGDNINEWREFCGFPTE